ncbi:MAG TPA: OmpH family outer membrane protein [Candidatus Cryptobacteroides merdipullorum]|uniref:OmpH family outer membrane protein n=1 Tax=Candidatus Cryptobacteroides merdipullorum TaxID=2840771 RepID=A0A9D1GP18_9BACT|nr:OmpH family outer membrane protein [Candidatus Cryptobacteroides merdipullorum]
MKKIIVAAVMAFVGVAAFAQPKFAHVNYAELVQLCPEADSARATMTASSNEAQATYQAMVEEFNAKYEDYQSKAGTWTASIRQTKEQELTDIQQRIQQFSQNVDMELQQQQQQLMAPIYEKALNAVKDLAKAGGYIYVFDVSSLLYYDAAQSTDLTPDARKALNIPEGRTLESLQAELQAQAQQAQGVTAAQ